MTHELINNLIDGEWVTSDDKSTNINPANVEEVIGLYARASASDVSDAAKAAHIASETWRYSSPQIRADLLEKIASAILSRKDEIGRLLAREEGKTLPEAVGETVRAAQIFKFFSGEALRVTGDALASVRPDMDVEVTREPLGTIGIITPWNFPIAIPAWKIAPALAYGNTVLFKPADLTPGCGHMLASIIHQAGCPKGVFNLVMGRGSVVGEAMVENPLINGISFTGSVPIGRALAVKAAEHMKKLQLEMGGKNPMVVMDDADLDVSIPVCINGAFFSTGQRCTASSRLLVHEKIYDDFVMKLSSETKKLTVGDPLEDGIAIGPVVSENQLKGNLDYVALAQQEGADVVGGERLNLSTNGFFQSPAIFLNATNEMRIAQEEIFGPCATVIKIGNIDDAIETANNTQFGLSAGICTSSLRNAREFKRRSRAGMVMVNVPTAGVDYHVPFGGTKGSSYGAREQGRYAIEFYTSVKTSYLFAP